MRKAGLVAKRIQGAKGLRAAAQGDVDRRFPGLLDSILRAGAATRPARHKPHRSPPLAVLSPERAVVPAPVRSPRTYG